MAAIQHPSACIWPEYFKCRDPRDWANRISKTGFGSGVVFRQVLVVSALKPKIIRTFLARVKDEKLAHNYLMLMTGADAADSPDFFNFIRRAPEVRTTLILAATDIPPGATIHYILSEPQPGGPILVRSRLRNEEVWINPSNISEEELNNMRREWHQRQKPIKIKGMDVEVRKAYELLGFADIATLEPSFDVIRKQYRKLATRHHPDKGGNAAHFNEIVKAYELLARVKGE